MLALTLTLLLCSSPGVPHELDGRSVIRLDGAWQARLSDEGGLQDTGVWQPIRVPGNFPFQGVTYDGVAWMRTRFTVPAPRPPVFPV